MRSRAVKALELRAQWSCEGSRAVRAAELCGQQSWESSGAVRAARELRGQQCCVCSRAVRACGREGVPVHAIWNLTCRYKVIGGAAARPAARVPTGQLTALDTIPAMEA